MERYDQIFFNETQKYSQFVFFFQIHKKLGHTHLALMHFSWAMDLDPKGTHTQIKESIDPSLSRGAGEDDIVTAQDAAIENEGAEASLDPTTNSAEQEQSFQESDESF